MNVFRITPRMICCAMSAHLGLWLLVSIPAKLGMLPSRNLPGWTIRMIACCVALFIASWVSFYVAGEYRNARWLRLAWLAIAANGGLSIFRMIAENPVWTAIWPGYSVHVRGLVQHLFIVPANLSLLIAVAAMCIAYHHVRIGFEIKKRDMLLIVGIASVISGLMIFRGGLSEANSPFLAGRILQHLGLICLAIVSAVSVLLHRMSVQMDGGRLAAVLQVITLYTLSRCVLVLFTAVRPAGAVMDILLTISWQAVQWLPALAAALRLTMTVEAVRELERLELGMSLSGVGQRHLAASAK